LKVDEEIILPGKLSVIDIIGVFVESLCSANTAAAAMQAKAP
jgi:hypothetical protein